MRVLVACEESGVVRRAFRRVGHEAWSCDLLPARDESAFHIREDVRDVMGEGWDLMIAHPPCTYLCNSAVWALTRVPPNPSPGVLYGEQRWQAMTEAVELFKALLDAPIPKVAVENPVMHRYARERIGQDYQQRIQPFEYGEDASKATCLWLKNLPPLMATMMIVPRLVGGKPRWGNQTDGGQNKLTPSADRGQVRGVTYQGIADAMASQWGER